MIWIVLAIIILLFLIHCISLVVAKLLAIILTNATEEDDEDF